MKNNLNFFGMPRLGGSSEASGKRRAVKPGSTEWLEMDRPNSLVKVIGYISPSQGSKKADYPLTDLYRALALPSVPPTPTIKGFYNWLFALWQN